MFPSSKRIALYAKAIVAPAALHNAPTTMLEIRWPTPMSVARTPKCHAVMIFLHQLRAEQQEMRKRDRGNKPSQKEERRASGAYYRHNLTSDPTMIRCSDLRRSCRRDATLLPDGGATSILSSRSRKSPILPEPLSTRPARSTQKRVGIIKWG